jgi:hypothetical protein
LPSGDGVGLFIYERVPASVPEYVGANMMEEDTQLKIWRYMDLAKFVSLISRRELYFACVSDFQDPYEGVYPKSYVQAISAISQNHLAQARATRNQMIAMRPDIDVGALDRIEAEMKERLERAFKDVRLKFGITCWHINEVESEAMWKLYSAVGYGIAIESSVGQLQEAIADKGTLVVDRVRYVDFESDPIEKGHKNYALFLKRKSFEHERELRATVLLNEEGKGCFVKCDLETLVSTIHVSPLAPDYFKDVVESICSGNLAGISKPVIRSSLFDTPGDGYGLNLEILA